jgi:hypothetical protein
LDITVLFGVSLMEQITIISERKRERYPFGGISTSTL